MSSNIHLQVASNQLRQDLSQIVDNFTLLDILSKEEKDLVLETKIETVIKRKNEERMRRHQEIEEDKRLASRDGSTVSSMSSPSSQTPPPVQAMNTPVQQLTSPSSDSGLASPASSTEKWREDSGHQGDRWKTNRGPTSSGAKPKQDFYKESSSVKLHTETLEIELHTEGTGLGFGVMTFPGIGVTVKTILPDGVAGKDGRLHSGDLLLEINGIDVANKSLDEEYSILKRCQGDVRLVVSREIMQVPKGPSSQRRDGQRRGPTMTKDQSLRPKKEDLVVTFQNDWMERDGKVKRKVVMRGEKKEDLTISVEPDQSSPLGWGGRGGARGRGRMVRINREEARQKEFEEKQRENSDRVEAEIAVLREALENQQKASGAVNPPSESVYGDLNDAPRYRADSQQERPPRRNRQEGGRQNQSSRGGTAGRGGYRRDQRGQGGTNQGQRGNPSDAETTVKMAEKERREYEEWKRERDKIDQERIRRHQKAAARQTNRNSEKQEQKEEWKSETRQEEDRIGKTEQRPEEETEMKIGHWDSSDAANEYKDIRSTKSHFEHDDRGGDQQRPQSDSRSGSGRFTQEGNQRGRGGGRGFHNRDGRGQDQGRRGRGGYDRGNNRPGRNPTGLTDRELSQTDIRTVPGIGYDSRIASSAKTSQDSAIGQWQPTKELDWDEELALESANSDVNTENKKLPEAAKKLHIGPLPSATQHDGDACKSPLSPVSPFTPTGHTFLTDWAAETEAQSNEHGLVFTNSNIEQGS